MSWMGWLLLLNTHSPRGESISASLQRSAEGIHVVDAGLGCGRYDEVGGIPMPGPHRATAAGRSAPWNAATELAIGISVACPATSARELRTPSAASPIAPRTSWLKEKPGPMIGMSTPDSAYCFMNAMPMPPGRKAKTGIRTGRANLRDFARIVRLANLGVDLIRQFALVEALEAGQRVRSRRIVRRHDEHVGIVFVGVRPHRLVQIVVLVGRVEVVLMAVCAGQSGGAGVGRDVDDILLHRARHDGQVARFDQMMPVRMSTCSFWIHAVGDLDGRFGLLGVVFDDDLDLFVARPLDGEEEGVANVDA